jgi:hypothetical protein
VTEKGNHGWRDTNTSKDYTERLHRKTTQKDYRPEKSRRREILYRDVLSHERKRDKKRDAGKDDLQDDVQDKREQQQRKRSLSSKNTEKKNFCFSVSLVCLSSIFCSSSCLSLRQETQSFERTRRLDNTRLLFSNEEKRIQGVSQAEEISH